MSSYIQQRLAEIKSERGHETKRRSAQTGRKYVSKETTRHGKTVYYYRRDGAARFRLPDPDVYGEAAFNLAIAAAERGERTAVPTVGQPRVAYTLEIGRPGFVYFLKMGGSVKIGFSTKVGKRLRAIQTSCPEPAEIIKIIPGSDQTERYFHAHFASHRQSGEWFRLDGALAAFLSVQA